MYSFAQGNDTIQLKEVNVQKVNKKIKYLKTKGTASSMTGTPIKSIISKLDKIPPGKLSSIKFYFNSRVAFFIPDTDKKDYKDVELGLLIYGVKEDGSPGELLTDKEIRFTVAANNKGSIVLDLDPLYLSSAESLYFGIELFNKQTGKDFKIMTLHNEKNGNKFYMKSWNKDDWTTPDLPWSIKMELGIKLLH